MESDHYRLIAILPVLSKVYERLVLSQLLEYVELERLFQDITSGYCKGHSTNFKNPRWHTVIQAMKKGGLTLIAFAEFSKIFDTVDYFFIVIRKLHAIGLSNAMDPN